MQLIDRVLALFPAGQQALHLLSESNAARIQAEDRLSAKTEECEWLRRELEAARSEALNAVKALANAGWQQRYGWRVYPEAGGIPEGVSREETPGPINTSSAQMRDMRRKAFADFREQGPQIWEEANKAKAS